MQRKSGRILLRKGSGGIKTQGIEAIISIFDSNGSIVGGPPFRLPAFLARSPIFSVPVLSIADSNRIIDKKLQE
jgi:hypothetical protein